MLSAIALAAAVEGTFTLVDRTEVRVRAPDPVTNETAYDVENAPNGRLTLTTPTTIFVFGYAPHLDYVDFNVSGAKPSLMNAGVASLQWHERRVRITVAESASYGKQPFAALSVLPTTGSPAAPAGTQTTVTTTTTPLPTAQAIPAVELLSTLSTFTSLTSQLTFRKLMITGFVGYQVSGGADATAQQILPLDYGPLAEVDFDLTATGRDHLLTMLKGSETNFSTGVDSLVAELDERWSHKWSRATDTVVTAGIAGVQTEILSAPSTFAADPTVDAAINSHIARGVNAIDLRAEAGVGPMVNALTGLVDQRVFGTLQAGWTHRKVGIRVFATAMETVPQSAQGAFRLFQGEIDALYHVTKAVTVDGGLRGIWQDQGQVVIAPAPGAPGTATPAGIAPAAVAFLGLTINAPVSRF